jgi:hypothetical protein
MRLKVKKNIIKKQIITNNEGFCIAYCQLKQIGMNNNVDLLVQFWFVNHAEVVEKLQQK